MGRLQPRRDASGSPSRSCWYSSLFVAGEGDWDYSPGIGCLRRQAMGTSEGKRKILVLGASLLVLFAILAALNAFNNGIPNPATTQQFFVFTGLSILAFLLFVMVLLLLVRNVLKLYANQRSRVMGSRLRTRMLWGAVLVSLIPIVFMLLFSYGLMNRAVERWFSGPVTEM